MNKALDNKSEIEKSVGRHWSTYAREELQIPDEERRTYQHQLPNGMIVDPWAYPIRYLPDFRRWIKEIYFVEKFAAYRDYRAKQIGIDPSGFSEIKRLPR